MKCKHEWRLLHKIIDVEEYYCIHCLATVRMDNHKKGKVQERKYS